MGDYDFNAYESPQLPQQPQNETRHKDAARSRLMAPAIVLIVLSAIGAILSLFNAVSALTMEAFVDPNAPEFLRTIQENTVGPVAAVTQSFFLIVNIFVIFGAISMIRVKTYAIAMAGAIAAMLNMGSCCCVPSLPFAIWALVVLTNTDVKRGFS